MARIKSIHRCQRCGELTSFGTGKIAVPFILRILVMLSNEIKVFCESCENQFQASKNW